MRYFIGLLSVVLVAGCMNQKSRQFKAYLLGDWRIENPMLQSFIRFEANGKTTYFMNRYSYERDSLAEIGKWNLDEIRKGQYADTFLLTIDKQPQKTVFKIIALDQNKIKVLDDQGHTFFTRIDEKN